MLRRTISAKGVSILLLVILLAGCGLFFLHLYQVKRQMGIYLQQADQAEAAQNPKKSIEYLERYLMLRPQDADKQIYEQVTLRYGRLLDDLANTPAEQGRAYLRLEKILREFPSQKEIKLRAAKRAKDIKRFRDAREHLNELLASNDGDIELLELIAECEKGLNDLDAAAEKHFEIILKHPEHLQSYERLAEWMKEKNNLESYKWLAEWMKRKKNPEPMEAAVKMLDEMVQKNDKSARAYLIQSNFLNKINRDGDAEKAGKALQKASDLSKNNETVDLFLARANLATNGRKFEEAMKYLNQGMKAYPKDARLFLAAAHLELRRGPENRQQALSYLHQAQPNVVEPVDQLMLANLLLDAGDKEEAKRLIISLRTSSQPNSLIEYISGRLLYEEGKLAESASLFESIKGRPELSSLSDISYKINMLLASAYRQLNNPERVLASYEAALKAIPTALPALQAKADTLGGLGRYSEAIDLYHLIMPKAPSASLGLLRLGLLRWVIAREQQKEPQDWKEAQTLLKKFSPKEKESPDYLLLAWNVPGATEKPDALRQAITTACTNQPKEIRFWLAKVALEEKTFINDEAARGKAVQETLNEAEKHLGDRVEFRLIRARLLLNSQDTTTRSALLEKLQEGREQFQTAEQVTLLTGLGEIYQRLDMKAKAKELFKKAITLAPRNWNAYFHLLDMAIEEKNDDETDQLIKTLREIEGEQGIAWRLGRIERFFFNAKPNDLKAINETRQLITELSNLRPGWHRTATLQALLLELEGEEISALEQYRKAIELGERKPEVVKRTVQLLMKNRNLAEARQVLSLAMNQSNSLSDYNKLDTELLLKEQKLPTDAIDLARKNVRDSKDYHEHLWLGQVLLAAGDERGAEAPLRQAVTLGGQDPSTWANWILYLVKMNRQEEAAREMKHAEEVLKNQSSFISYVAIPYYETLGKRELVESEYKKLIDKNPQDVTLWQNRAAYYFRIGEVGKAEADVKQITQMPDVSPGIARWARRSYALALAVKGDYQSFHDAQALLEKNLSESVLSPQDLNARALIMAVRPGLRQSAIKDLEKSFDIQKPSPNEAILLAQLYEDEGNWQKAAVLWDKLIASKEGETPFYLGQYIRAMLRNKKIDQAADALKKLDAKAPRDPLTADVTVRVWLAQGKKRDALNLLERKTTEWFAERKDPSVFLASAQMLEEAGEIAAAEIHLKRFLAETLDKKPQAILVKVGFLARQGKVSEALALCDANWNKLPPGEIGMAAVSSLHFGTPREEEFNKVEANLEAARRSHPNDLQVSLALADLYSLRGESGKPKAIKIYRDILLLKDQQQNPLVLNNLAWLLSDDRDQLEEAVELINLAIKRVGPDGSLLDTRGMILLRQKKPSEAIPDFAEAVSQAPRPTRFMHLALAYHQDNRETEAEQTWKKAVSLGLDFGKLPQSERNAYAELAEVYKNKK